MSEKTGYQACVDMVDLLMKEQENLRAMQRQRARGDDFTAKLHALARACAVVQTEIRKTGEEADEAVRNLPPVRRLELVINIIRDLSPEFHEPIRIFLEERREAGLM